MAIIYNHLPEIDRKLGAQGVTFINEYAASIVEHAKQNAPVRTGYLRDHIHVEREGDESVAAVSEAPYSEAVNFGTARRAPNPFFSLAIQQASEDVEALVRKVFG